jgi:hypothetical protein
MGRLTKAIDFVDNPEGIFLQHNALDQLTVDVRPRLHVSVSEPLPASATATAQRRERYRTQMGKIEKMLNLAVQDMIRLVRVAQPNDSFCRSRKKSGNRSFRDGRHRPQWQMKSFSDVDDVRKGAPLVRETGSQSEVINSLLAMTLLLGGSLVFHTIATALY